MIKEVKDFPGYFVTACGVVIGKRGRPLKVKITRDGYEEIVLSDSDRRRCARVHILVAECHLGDRPEGLVINHKDGNKLNNTLYNLEYVTVGRNARHAVSSGLISSKNDCLSSLKAEDFAVMISLYKEGKTYKEIVKTMNLNIHRDDYIGEILSGSKLSEVSGITEDIRRHKQHTKVSDAGLLVMKSLRESNPGKYTYTLLSSIYGISLAQISRILNGSRRKGVFA
jgi:hypothetical protein